MSSSSNAIAELFSIGAEHYDAVRRNLVPCFDAFYTSALDVIGDWGRGRERGALDVLDLGAGTGLFSAMVMAGIPQARVHLIDVSDAMLAEARRRFAGVAASNVKLRGARLLRGEPRRTMGPRDLRALHPSPGGRRQALIIQAGLRGAAARGVVR